MAVVHFAETTGRSGSQDADSNKRYTRTFQVLCDSAQDGAAVVLAYPEIPAFNDAYAYIDDSGVAPVLVTDTQAVVVDIRVSQDDPENLQNWTVTVEYAGVEDPTAQPAEVEYSPTRYQQHIVEDVNGVAVKNSAGDPFESGAAVDRTRYTLTIVKNRLVWDPVAADAYNDTLNQLDFLAGVHPPGFPPGTCKLTTGCKRVRRRGTFDFYWQVTATVDIDKRGWTVRLRDAGLNHIVAGKRQRMIDPDTGAPYSTPQLLDGAGGKLAVGGVPVVNEFDGYESKDWTPLNLEY